MYAIYIYANIYHQYTPVMFALIYHTVHGASGYGWYIMSHPGVQKLCGCDQEVYRRPRRRPRMRIGWFQFMLMLIKQVSTTTTTTTRIIWWQYDYNMMMMMMMMMMMIPKTSGRESRESWSAKRGGAGSRRWFSAGKASDLEGKALGFPIKLL